MTFTVVPVQGTTDVSTINDSDTTVTVATTTCEETQTSTATPLVNYTYTVMVHSSESTALPSSLSPVTPSGSSTPGLLDGAATPSCSMVDTESPTPRPVSATTYQTPRLVSATTYDAPSPVDNTDISQSSPELGITLTSTIEITSTVTVVVATVTADLPDGEDEPSSVSSTKTKAFPEPYATMTPNVPPYVQQTSDDHSVPSSIEPTSAPSDTLSTTKAQTEEVANTTLEEPKPTIEIFTTITNLVTVLGCSSCEAATAQQTSSIEDISGGSMDQTQSASPTDVTQTQSSALSGVDETDSTTTSNSDASTEVIATSVLPAASTAVIIGAVPTIYSYQPQQQNNLNTLVTQSSGLGAATDTDTDTPTLTGTIAPASTATGAAGRVYTGYASLVAGLLVAAMLLL